MNNRKKKNIYIFSVEAVRLFFQTSLFLKGLLLYTFGRTHALSFEESLFNELVKLEFAKKHVEWREKGLTSS